MVFPFQRLIRDYERRILALLASGREGELWRLFASADFQRTVWEVAAHMVREAENVNERTWRAAAFKSQNGRKIYSALQRELADTGIAPELRKIARRNAKLISSLPREIAERVSEHAATAVQEGLRPEELARFIRAKRADLTRSRVKLIARTEVSKAVTDLRRARAEQIGLDFYQWATSEDARVRPSHRNMDQVLVRWGDPPDPETLIGEKSNAGHYHAGQTFQCRCLALPVVSLDEIHFPARVYHAGRITRITLAQFAKLAGLQKAA